VWRKSSTYISPPSPRRAVLFSFYDPFNTPITPPTPRSPFSMRSPRPSDRLVLELPSFFFLILSLHASPYLPEHFMVSSFSPALEHFFLFVYLALFPFLRVSLLEDTLLNLFPFLVVIIPSFDSDEEKLELSLLLFLQLLFPLRRPVPPLLPDRRLDALCPLFSAFYDGLLSFNLPSFLPFSPDFPFQRPAVFRVFSAFFSPSFHSKRRLFQFPRTRYRFPPLLRKEKETWFLPQVTC